jgi:lipoate-protein ligase A
MIWRFLDTGSAAGEYNMAFDAAMARGGGYPLPTLRVFRWQPFCISLGFHQNAEEVNLPKCEAEGLDVVRRPTAGRAILHAQELTYSVVIPAAHAWYQMLPLDLYRRLSEAIAAGLQLLGVNIEFAPGERLHQEGKPLRLSCFASTARNEITAHGKKVVGSAQRRFREGVLQHGSILLQDEHERLQQRTTTLAGELSRFVTFDQAAHALRTGFENVLDIAWSDDEISSVEKELAERWCERYRILSTNQQEHFVCADI